MTTTDYPDLTAASATTVDDLLPQARTDMESLLEAGRRTPLAPVPDGPACEPAHSTALLAASSVPASPIEVPAPTVRTDAPVHELGVLDLLAAYRSGATTPTDVLAALRARWSDPELSGGAVLAVIDGADDAAADSDRRWSDGTARPLEGIFFAVKDIIDVAGAPVTAGSRTTGDRIAATDATVVARLRAAGAIPVLMTATTEFACGAPHNARYGAVTNPWDRNRWTGGSSTGSAGSGRVATEAWTRPRSARTRQASTRTSRASRCWATSTPHRFRQRRSPRSHVWQPGSSRCTASPPPAGP